MPRRHAPFAPVARYDFSDGDLSAEEAFSELTWLFGRHDDLFGPWTDVDFGRLGRSARIEGGFDALDGTVLALLARSLSDDGHAHGNGHGPGHSHGAGHGPGHSHGKAWGRGKKDRDDDDHGGKHDKHHKHGKDRKRDRDDDDDRHRHDSRDVEEALFDAPLRAVRFDFDDLGVGRIEGLRGFLSLGELDFSAFMNEGAGPRALNAGRDALRLGDADDYAALGLGGDRAWGGDGDDELIGEDGRDRLSGGDGEDLLDGGADRDRLRGGDDDDVLIGGAGNDRMRGGDGDDELLDGGGSDRMAGDEGDDVFIWSGVGRRDAIIGFESGEDLVDLSEVEGRVRIDLDPADDRFAAVVESERGTLYIFSEDDLDRSDFLL